MTDDKKLIEQLRGWGAPTRQRAKPLMREAAARLEALTATQGEAAVGEIIDALLAGEPFVFDPATHFMHADDGGAPEHGIKYVHVPLYAHPTPDRGELVDRMPTSWELKCNEDPDFEGELQWQVYRVDGGRNDREWTLIGSGETPSAALRAALAKEGTPNG